ncbi:Cruciform cutting endonuclease 1 like protein [Teratosphaeria destructans]|uniref:Cruciform cutting endonuclease 1 like protein n=1 Tax=Teratosphaeria destructans TaxID=418781 RepID=A0A9W7SJX2_9PEZI|nr:Cruciform cutting endonuclease 1 like protein [Teratosphaeria destructans]
MVPLPALKAWQLKHASFLTGLPSTGTKAALEAVLRARLDARQRAKLVHRPHRVLSVDMGIRNLAYCVLDVPEDYSSTDRTPLTVSTWRKRDLTTTATSSETSIAETQEDARTPSRRRTPRAPIAKVVDPTLFTPSVLSKTAHAITMDLLALNPDSILIERQRFRSGGASAIQEWTVRVNMLESMLWACLQTQKSHHEQGDARPFPSVHEVNPARVAQFWTSASEVSLIADEHTFRASAQPPGQAVAGADVKESRRKVQKKDKIAIARRWLAGEDSAVRLEFEGQAAEVAQVFGRRGRVRLREEGFGAGMEVGKLDDLADCLLQGVAWMRWEENAGRLRRILDAGGDGM